LALIAFLPAGDAVARVAPAAPRPPAPAGQATPFAPTLLPSFSGSAVEGVILADDSIATAFQPLADFHTRTGHPTVVRSIGTLRAADPRSNDLAQAIRSFLIEARTLWGARWVLLAADHESIPLRTVEVLFSHLEHIPSDAYYADLDGTWDGNGNGVYGEVADSLDMEPDLFVGRLPVTTRAEAEAQVAKILRYRRTPPPGAGSKHLLVAEVLFPYDWQPPEFVQADGAPLAESLRILLPACAQVDRLYENYTKYPGSSFLDRASALAAFSRGYTIIQHIDHGSRSQISVGADLITLADLATLSSGDSAALWISSNCASAAVDYDSFAEALLRKPYGGAIAYVGTTRDAWPGPNHIVAETVTSAVAPKFGSGVTLGEAMDAGRRALLPEAESETQHRWGYFESVLLGDPMLRIWRCEPETLTVTAPGSVALGSGGFLVQVTSAGAPVESALVVALKDGEEFRAAHSDASGDAWVPFHPASAGPFSLTVTRPDAIPWETTSLVTPSPTAHFRFVAVEDTDAAHGDADGRTDAGESFGFAGTIENSGAVASGDPVTIEVEALTGGLVIEQGSAVLPALGAGAAAPIPASLRVHVSPGGEPPRGERLRLIARDASRADTLELPIGISTPAPLPASSQFADGAPGNGNGVPDAGETVAWTWTIANEGSGAARGLIARARGAAAGVTILDSTASIGDLGPGTSAAATAAIRVAIGGSAAGRLFDIRIEDTRGQTWEFPVSRPALPAPPSGLRVLASGSDHVSLGWDRSIAARLLGYHVYRAPDDGSTLVRVTGAPVRAIPSFQDEGLALLTRYRYAVSAVDSSGNEGAVTPEIIASTTPPAAPGWPAVLGQATSSNVCLGDLDGDGRPEIVVGAERLYAFRADGIEVRDGDGIPASTGVFTSLLHNIASSPAMADLDLDGSPEIIAASWDDSLVAVFDGAGALLPGWPRKGAAPFWSTPSIGDVDQDGQPDVVIGSNSSRLYAWRADGSEIRDGDANPATDGVLFVPVGTVISSPSIVDLEKDGTPEIVFGTSGGRVYAMHVDAVLPGWPVTATGLFSSSPAIGDVVPGGSLEIVMASSNDSVYVFTADGARVPGWPRFVELTPGNGRTNSPVIAPIRKHLGDPTLYVVIGSMEGAIAVFGPDGNPRPEFAGVSIGAATEASPGVADLDGDGSLEILLAGEDRKLHAFHHDGTAVSGFPIEIGAEARGTPAVWDLDGDGSTEIALAGWDRKLHVWSYPGIFSAPGAAWPMWRHDNWRTGVASFPILTSADPPPAPEPVPPTAPPARAYLAPNRPNPFNPSTLLGFGVPGPGPADVVLRVVDVSGRVVATLVSRRLDPGYHERRWDGRDDRGRDLGSGIYFLHARIGSATLTRKLALVR
jgi:hypothetical protein